MLSTLVLEQALLFDHATATLAAFSIFGELKDQPSRLTPDEVMNSVIGKKVATGLHVAATLLLGEVLDTTYR